MFVTYRIIFEHFLQGIPYGTTGPIAPLRPIIPCVTAVFKKAVDQSLGLEYYSLRDLTIKEISR